MMNIPYLVVGIDPGMTGGFGLLFRDGATEGIRMPMFRHQLPGRTKSGAKKYRNKLDLVAIKKIFDRLKRIEREGKSVFMVLEGIHANPRFGAASSCEFGRVAGYLEMGIVMKALPYDTIASGKWRRQMVGTKTDKKASLALARRFWPSVSLELERDEGVAEALLMARWYIENHFGGKPLCTPSSRKTKTVKKSSAKSAKKSRKS